MKSSYKLQSAFEFPTRGLGEQSFNHPKVKSSYKLEKELMLNGVINVASFNHPKVKSSYKHANGLNDMIAISVAFQSP